MVDEKVAIMYLFAQWALMTINRWEETGMLHPD